MLRPRTAIQYPDGTLTAFRPSIGRAEVRTGQVVDVSLIRLAVERAIDGVIEDSFPASDPPSWNPGTARPAPAAHKANQGVSLAGAAGVTLLVGLGILLITVPVALFLGALIKAIGWLFNLLSV